MYKNVFFIDILRYPPVIADSNNSFLKAMTPLKLLLLTFISLLMLRFLEESNQ